MKTLTSTIEAVSNNESETHEWNNKSVIFRRERLSHALIEEFGYWTVPVTVVGAYFIIAGEGIAHHIEEPFGVQEDQLHLDTICGKIESSVSEICDA